ncbi:MAG: SurA N-terminal domain-containing protein, partial [Candidatus Omnitrophica bacterium]|nr:SurA N-terminal domain-containing protein [Candidatus Omnitrophota bacterium]
MLKVFRHKGVAKKVLWVVSTIIIISFAFGFSMSRYSSASKFNRTAGKLFGQNISAKDFDVNYQRTK